jgi:hypothetical protein
VRLQWSRHRVSSTQVCRNDSTCRRRSSVIITARAILLGHSVEQLVGGCCVSGEKISRNGRKEETSVAGCSITKAEGKLEEKNAASSPHLGHAGAPGRRQPLGRQRSRRIVSCTPSREDSE